MSGMSLKFYVEIFQGQAFKGEGHVPLANQAVL